MTAGDAGSIASAVAAFIALVVSWVSLHKTNKFNATAERLNRMLIEREAAEGLAAKRADLSANLIEVGRNQHRLKVFNRGQGTARNVRLDVLDKSERSILSYDDVRQKFPVPIMEQHQAVELIAALWHGSHLRAHIRLIWDDDTGTDREKELTPSW